MPPTETVDVLIFYFDIIGVVDGFAANPSVIDDIADFQRAVRQIPMGWGAPYTCLITAFDNVFARVNVNDSAGSADCTIVDFAQKTMQEAHRAGFEKYFGAITMGSVQVDLFDQHLVSGGDPTDIRSQHISLLGDPHIRAAFAEKWSAALHKQQQLPFNGQSCVWVGEEVFSPPNLLGLAHTGSLSIRVLGDFDLAQLPASGRRWPFTPSRFSGIRPR